MSALETQMPPVQRVSVNGIEMAYYEAGPRQGVPVILCHGFPELAFSWRHQIKALGEAGRWVIAPDQRGYGLTSRPEAVSDYDIEHLTGDLVGLMDHLGVEKAIFCGHDWGGIIVWQMPLLHPDRQVFHQGVGVDLQAEPLGELEHLAAGLAPVEQADRGQAERWDPEPAQVKLGRGQPAHRLGAERDVLGHGEDRHQHEVLVHHADLGPDRVPGRVDRDRLVVEQDLALVGLDQPVEHVHQRGLARAVLAEQSADLAGLDDQVDVVVGDEAAEALRDPAQLKLHWQPPSADSGQCPRPGPGTLTSLNVLPARCP